MKFLRKDGGQALVSLTLLMSIAALGFLGLAVDAGLLFRYQATGQTAADAVAVAAATEVGLGNTANEQSVANDVAKLNGFDTTLATNPATVSLSTLSSFNGVSSTYVTATVSKPVKTLFLGAFNHSLSTVTVTSQATAGGGSPVSTCVCLLGTSGNDLNINGGSKLDSPSCGVVENSGASNAIDVYGASTLNALSLGTVSTTWDNGSNIYGGSTITASTTIVQGLSTGCSVTLPTPPTYSSCIADPGGPYNNFTAGPASASGVICYNGLTIGSNGSTVTLNPGTYVISNGKLHFETGANGKSNLGGNGVFFYLVGTASLVIDSTANVNLVSGGSTLSGGGTAPTVGNYNGILVYQDNADTAAMSSAPSNSSYISGAILAPQAALTINSLSAATYNSALLAKTLTLTGGADLIVSPTSVSEGSVTVSSPRLVQ